MNFFEHQDQAKRNTRYLIILLIIAVVSLIAITTFAFALATYLTQPDTNGPILEGALSALSLEAMIGIAFGVTTVVILGSVFRQHQLRDGGRVVAESLGGRLINPSTTNLHERRILNIVEEMAIASGTSVPPIYLIEESAINAFAAGYYAHDAVIGITRGCIEQLTRDELQGVIAHEFSHIFHGDMRLNMRLVALVYGILVIGLIGRLLLEAVYHSKSSARNRSNDNNGSAIILIFVLGVSLVAIGYAGTFFGQLIKAAISRQREYLADAAAVQYTRNPDGIAGALSKIAIADSGSTLQASNAAEFSHMYFGSEGSSFFGLLATHPHIEQRIQRIHANRQVNLTPKQMSSAKFFGGDSRVSGFSKNTDHFVDQLIPQMADPSNADLNSARHAISDLPPLAQKATQSTFDARGIILGLLRHSDQRIREQQDRLIANAFTRQEYAQLQPVIEQASSLEPHTRLSVMDLALPSIKRLSSNQQRWFLSLMEGVIRADNHISVFEWSIFRIVRHHLVAPTPSYQWFTIDRVTNDLRVLFSLLALSEDNSQVINAAYNAGATRLGITTPPLKTELITLDAVDRSLSRIAAIKPLQKPAVLKAIHAIISADKTITPREAELFRAIADSIDCPIPPFDTLII